MPLSVPSFTTKGFTVLEALIAVVLLSLAAGFVIVKFGGVKERAYIDAQKNDLQNLALAQEQYFVEHQRYGHPDTLAVQDFFSYSDNVQLDSLDISSPQDWWYARTRHTKTDVKCELLFRSQDEVSGIAQRIVCPGAGEGSGGGGGDTNSEPDADFTVTGPTTTASNLTAQFDFNADQTGPIGSFAKKADLVFDGSPSSDPDGDALEMSWSFEGSEGVEIVKNSARGLTVVNRWLQGGTFTATLTVTDTHGASASVTKTLDLVNKPPNPVIQMSTEQPFLGEPVHMDGKNSTDPNNDQITDYSWELEDDTGNFISTTGKEVQRIYNTAGAQRVVRLTVTDTEGATGTAQDTIQVQSSSAELKHWWSSCETAKTEEWTQFKDAVGSHDLTLASDNGSVSSWENQWNLEPPASLQLEQSKEMWTSSALPGGLQDYTVMFLLKGKEQQRSNSHLMAGENQWGLLWEHEPGNSPTPNAQFWFENWGNTQELGGGDPPYDRWSTVALRVGEIDSNNSDVALFVNGQKRNSKQMNMDVESGVHLFNLENPTSSGSQEGFEGQVAHILLFQGNLTDSEVQQKHQELKGFRCNLTEVPGGLRADFDWTPETPRPDSSATFDASLSEADNQIVSYSWDFGDGTTATRSQPEIQHTFDQERIWPVQLVVEDNTGAVDTVVHDVSVEVANSKLVSWWDPCESVDSSTLVDVVGGFDMTLDSRSNSVSDWSNHWDKTFPTHLNVNSDRTLEMIAVDHPNFNRHAQDFAWLFRIKGDIRTGQHSLLLNSHSGPRNWPLWWNRAGAPTEITARNPANGNTVQAPIPSTWTTLGFRSIKDDATGDVEISLFLDGQLIEQRTSSYEQAYESSSTALFYNQPDFPNQSFQGEVSSIQYYEGEMTNAEMAEASQEIRNHTCGGLKPLHAAFTFTPESPTTDDTITFNAGLSSPLEDITSYEWTFWNGRKDTVSDTIITHSYDQPASYNVQLVVENSSGVVDTARQPVPVGSGHAGELVSWWRACESVGKNEFVDVVGGHDMSLTANGASIDWTQKWNKGSQASLQLKDEWSPRATPGSFWEMEAFTYIAKLKAGSMSGFDPIFLDGDGQSWRVHLTDGGGQWEINNLNSATTTLESIPSGWTTFALRKDTLDQVEIYIDGQSVQTFGPHWTWNFENDQRSIFFGEAPFSDNDSDKSFEGQIAGIRLIEGQLSDADVQAHHQELMDDRCSLDDLDETLVADFTYSPDQPNTGEIVTFDASSTQHTHPIDSYDWDFGDGATKAIQVDSVQHTYQSGGTQTVELVVTDTTGTKDTATAALDMGQTAELVSYWDPCESFGGSTLVDVLGGQDAALKSGNNTIIDAHLGGSAGTFDGSSGVVDISSFDGSFTEGDFTVEMWAQAPVGGKGGDGLPAAISSGVPSNWSDDLFILYIGETNQTPSPGLRVYWDGSNAVDQVSMPVDDGGWHHYALTRDASTGDFELYVDGSLTATGNRSGTFTSTSLSLGAGNNNGSFDQFFKGGLDDVRIWNDIRTQAEIQNNMNTELSGTETDLLHYYPLNEGSGSSTSDGAGSSTGSLSGGSGWANGWGGQWVNGSEHTYLKVDANNRILADLEGATRSATSWAISARMWNATTDGTTQSSIGRIGGFQHENPWYFAWDDRSADEIAFHVAGPSNVGAGTEPSKNAWHTLSIRAIDQNNGNTEFTLYIDGNQVGQGTTSDTYTMSGSGGFFHDYRFLDRGDLYWDGRASGIMYYEGVVSDSVIQSSHDRLSGSSGCLATNDQPPNAAFQASPTEATSGTEIELNGTEAFDPDGEIVQYEWDFGEGSGFVGAGEITSHTYSSEGGFTITQRVTDNQGLTDTEQKEVTMSSGIPITVDLTLTDTIMDQQAATDSFTATGERGTGDRLNLTTKLIAPDGSSTTHPDCQLTDILSPAECEGDLFKTQNGTWTVETTGSAGGVPSVTVSKDYRVTDLNYSCEVSVGVLDFTGADMTCEDQDGDTVCTLQETDENDSETGSTEPAVQWIFDGEASNPKQLKATIEGTGSKTSFGASGNSGARNWEVVNPSQGTTPHTGQGDPTGINVLTDQEVMEVLMPEPPNFTDPWTFTYGLYGSDPNSNAFAAAAVSFRCDEGTPNEPGQAPTADFTFNPSSPQTNEVVDFDATLSSDPDGTIESYDWDFGNGDLGTGLKPSETYQEDGDFSVTLSVVDNAGNTDQATKTVSVGNQPPTADFDFTPTQFGPGIDVQFSANASDPDGTVSSYDWQFGDGVSGTGSSPTHSYATAGDKTVELAATDNDGAADTTTQTLTVSDPLNTTLNLSSTDIASGSTGESFSATGEQPQGVQVSLNVDITKPDGTTVDGCQNSGAAPVSCSAALPTDQDGQYEVQATTSANNFQNHTTSKTYEVGTLQYTCSSWTLEDGSDIDGDSPGQTRSDITYEFRVPNTDPANLKILTWAEVPQELGTNDDNAWVMEGTALQNIPGDAANSWETWEPARPSEGTQSQAASGSGDRQPGDGALAVREPTCDPGQLEGQCGRRVETLLPDITDQSSSQTLVYHVEARYGDSVNDPPLAEKNFRVEISCSDEVQ